MDNMILLKTHDEMCKLHGYFYNKPLNNEKDILIPKIIDQDLEYRIVNGFIFIISKNDTCIANAIRGNNLYEKFILSFVKEYIDSSKNIIDLGANIGTHSVIYSGYTTGKVYSFEPQKSIWYINWKY